MWYLGVATDIGSVGFNTYVKLKILHFKLIEYYYYYFYFFYGIIKYIW